MATDDVARVLMILVLPWIHELHNCLNLELFLQQMSCGVTVWPQQEYPSETALLKLEALSLPTSSCAVTFARNSFSGSVFVSICFPSDQWAWKVMTSQCWFLCRWNTKACTNSLAISCPAILRSRRGLGSGECGAESGGDSATDHPNAFWRGGLLGNYSLLANVGCLELQTSRNL